MGDAAVPYGHERPHCLGRSTRPVNSDDREVLGRSLSRQRVTLGPRPLMRTAQGFTMRIPSPNASP